MLIDLGTCRFEFSDDALLVPVQLVARGGRDEMPAVQMGLLKGAKVKAQGYSRFFNLTIEELPEGANESSGLDHFSGMLVHGFRGQDVEARELPTEGVLSRLLNFKFRGPNEVPLQARALVQVKGIVGRTCVLAFLDTPKVVADAEKQFMGIIGSLTPEPKIVP